MDSSRGTGDSSRGRRGNKAPYFLKPEREGMVSVYRRPAGNRIDPKLCGTMPNRAMAAALVGQLMRAESVVKDLFLEATDDGIEALEAVLLACRNSVVERGARGGAPRGGGPRPGGARRRGRRRGGPRDLSGGDGDGAPSPEMDPDA
ncbi:MAG TPA: hypothetical protein VFH14_06435 [Gemmatimonadaceae bacterium]|nr:hypothetical protein [Gemmatimonadaceae bacterium]